MRSKLLALPAELKLQISESLTPFAVSSSDFHYGDCRTLADDIDFVSTSFRHLRNFFMTCKDMQALRSPLVFQAMDLTNEGSRKRFIEDLANGTLPAPIRDNPKTRFLSVGRFGDDDSDLWDETAGYELCERDFVINKIFTHFSAITTLDLVNFPLSKRNICALGSLKTLRTLSIREPHPSYKSFPFIGRYRKRWSMPAVSNLSIVVNDFKACCSISGIIKFFEPSIAMLSIKSDSKGGRKGDIKKLDFLGIQALCLEQTSYMNLANLKHLSMGYLKFGSLSFRHFIVNCRSLESLAVDCRGAEGFMPLFYIFDLLRIITGESDDEFEMMEYDWIQEGYDKDPDMQITGMEDPYVTDATIWRRRISSFYCTFNFDELCRVKTVKHLELVLASSDENSEPINTDIRLDEVSEVFRKRARTFPALETLSIAMSNEVSFESTESEDQLKATISEICRRSLPSVRKLDVDWGQVFLSAERPNSTEEVRECHGTRTP